MQWQTIWWRRWKNLLKEYSGWKLTDDPLKKQGKRIMFELSLSGYLLRAKVSCV